MNKDLDKNRPPENSKPPLFIHSVTQRTYKCFDCKYYNVKTGKIRGSVNKVCNVVKNDPRIIVNLDAPDCNDYVYVE